MSGEVMLFPATVEEFIEQYKVVDRDHAISNGAEFIPVFRMKQWFDHLQAQPLTNADRMRKWANDEIAEFTIGIVESTYERLTGEKMPTYIREKMKAEWIGWLQEGGE